MTPRFAVTEMEGMRSVSYRRAGLECNVVDRAYNHQVVARFTSEQTDRVPRLLPGLFVYAARTREGRFETVRDNAATRCDQLNAKHDAWLATLQAAA